MTFDRSELSINITDESAVACLIEMRAELQSLYDKNKTETAMSDYNLYIAGQRSAYLDVIIWITDIIGD
jgi:hypothetical protein